MTATFWEIRDRLGVVRAIHKRRDLPDGGKDVIWLQPDGKQGLNGTPVNALPLYGAHRLAEWPELVPIVLTEGEKAADALTGAGIPAVGTVTGAAVTPSTETLADLAGRAVVLWADNDDAGRKHMAAIADVLNEIAAVALVEWPDAPPKGDAADFLANGRTAVDVRELLATARDADACRTLADIDTTPPGPLLAGMLEPNAANLLYARGGTGKGSTGAWIVVHLQQLGLRCAIYDPEYRGRQWAARVAGLGGDCSQVDYLVPQDLGPKLAGKPLWDVAPAIGRLTRRADVRFVDSILPAIGVGEDRAKADASVPFQYVRALEALGGTAVSFGLTPKGQPAGEPYGSMAWVAAHRFTWLGTRAEGDAGTHRVRWQPRKRNERGHVAPYLFTFSYGDDDQLCAATREDDDQTTRQRLLDALADREAHSVADLAEEWLADEPEHITAEHLDRIKETLSRSLRRLARDGLVVREGSSGPKVRWRL